MRVIFLDVDGVLNSLEYWEKISGYEHPLDERSIVCLKKIVDQTNSKIVLSSSWRGGWDKKKEFCKEQGKILNHSLNKFGLEIYDKTENLNYSDGKSRCREIKKWINECPYKIEGFLILDDADFGWKEFGLKKRWIQTDFLESGLNEIHIKESVNILKKISLKLFLRNIQKDILMNGKLLNCFKKFN